MYKELDLKKAYLLVESGPVTIITTADGKKNNAMTISWTMVNDFDGRFALVTGAWNHSFKAMTDNKECVICIPSAAMLETAVKLGAVSGADIDKFKEFNLAAIPGSIVKAPLIAGCLGAIECRVEDYIEKYDIVILRAVKAWIDEDITDRRVPHAVGDGTFTLDGEKVNLRHLMEEKLLKN